MDGVHSSADNPLVFYVLAVLVLFICRVNNVMRALVFFYFFTLCLICLFYVGSQEHYAFHIFLAACHCVCYHMRCIFYLFLFIYYA